MIGEAMRRLEVRGLAMLPVVEPANQRRLLGLVTHEDLRQAYDRGISRRARQVRRAAETAIEDGQDMNLIYVEVPTGAAVDGALVSGLDLPYDCLIVSIERQGRRSVVRGGTAIRAGDRVALVVTPDNAVAARDALTAPTSGDSEDPL